MQMFTNAEKYHGCSQRKDAQERPLSRPPTPSLKVLSVLYANFGAGTCAERERSGDEWDNIEKKLSDYSMLCLLLSTASHDYWWIDPSQSREIFLARSRALNAKGL